MAADKLIGFFLIVISLVIFVYYSTWVLILPFVDQSHNIVKYFPPRIYAISIPATLLVGFIVCISIFIGLVSRQEILKNKNK